MASVLLFGLFLAGSMELPKEYAGIPLLDLNQDQQRQIVVDKEAGQYLGHPTTLLLEDGKTILTVYPKGHGKGAIILKRSNDAGKTWSDRLPVPENWATSLETPTIHRVIDASGKKRIIVFSGLYPARTALSEDDGKSWSPLKPIGDWGGIVVMGSVIPLKAPGHYLALFHDDGRFFTKDGKKSSAMTLFQTRSTDGGITWEKPETILSDSQVHLCEPGAIFSPDGKQIAVLLRENRRIRESHLITTQDEGKTWSTPRELPRTLTGDRHTAKYSPDGRLLISFRDMAKDSPTKGDWIAWVGNYSDLIDGKPGQYRIRLKDNFNKWDCAYPGVEVLNDGTFVVTTYGHWEKDKKPYILSVRLTLKEMDRMIQK